MRSLEDIEKDLAAAREDLSSVEGTQAEVYSRIVGYYRSVRNWNKGKKEEYGERQLYTVSAELPAAMAPDKMSEGSLSVDKESGASLLLFVRAACPACPSAKEAAGKLGIPVNMMSADTKEGMAEAVRYNVMSTPTAILLSSRGEEIKRARDAQGISQILNSAPLVQPLHSAPSKVHAEAVAV